MKISSRGSRSWCANRIVNLASLLQHLAELDSRRLYLEQACSSLFAYCVQRLGFSEAATYNRITAARLGRRHPVVLEHIEAGRLHLTAVRLLAPHLTNENHAELLNVAAGRSKRGLEELLLYDHEHGSALTALIERTFEGQNSTRSDDVALATEAWADTFTMQVVGGSNYIEALNTRAGAVNFCDQAPCMELNYRGVNDYTPVVSDPKGDYPFYDELARYQSLIHDACDRPNSSARGTLAPWNGDVSANTFPLSISPTGYIGFDDESVTLPGPLWRNWANHFTDASAAGAKQLMRALSLTMVDNDDDWCNRCELPWISGSRPLQPC